MYQPGDVVVYHHRVCKVAAIREAYYEGRDYYELQVLFDESLKLYVALDRSDDIRPVMSRNQALDLIDSYLDAQPIDETSVLNAATTPMLVERRMKEEYDRRLKLYRPEELLPIMKSVHAHSVRRKEKGRAITATDKKYFDLAEGLLCDELAVALGIERDQVRDYMVDRIRRAERARLSVTW